MRDSLRGAVRVTSCTGLVRPRGSSCVAPAGAEDVRWSPGPGSLLPRGLSAPLATVCCMWVRGEDPGYRAGYWHRWAGYWHRLVADLALIALHLPAEFGPCAWCGPTRGGCPLRRSSIVAFAVRSFGSSGRSHASPTHTVRWVSWPGESARSDRRTSRFGCICSQRACAGSCAGIRLLSSPKCTSGHGHSPTCSRCSKATVRPQRLRGAAEILGAPRSSSSQGRCGQLWRAAVPARQSCRRAGSPRRSCRHVVSVEDLVPRGAHCPRTASPRHECVFLDVNWRSRSSRGWLATDCCKQFRAPGSSRLRRWISSLREGARS
jgi:hypothetical protein